MAKIKIRIESVPTTDTYTRYHGRTIDEPLKEDFWVSQAGASIRVPLEETVELRMGKHYVEYGNSGLVPEYAWHARIYINDQLAGEGDVGRNQHLKVDFFVLLRRAIVRPKLLGPTRTYLSITMLAE